MGFLKNTLFYFAAGVVLLLAAGLVNADYYSSSSSTSADGALSVDIAINSGSYPVYTHYCSYSYYYGYYYCNPYAAYGASYGVYCDPFDPFRYAYCYSGTYYPTYTVNPGTIVYTSNGAGVQAQQAAPGPACSDGTPAGFCSTNYPRYCLTNGNQSQLIDKATLCGCPAGQVQDPTNANRCVAQTCSDGTSLNTCSSTKPKFCTSNAFLVDRPSQCGCPSGTSLQGDSCVPLNAVCFVSSTSPSTVRAGESSVVTVSYSDVQNAAGYVNCGNGQVASLACSGGQTGTCTASCSYSSAGTSTVQAYVNGRLCSSSSIINTAPQLPTTGDVLARVTDCSTNLPVPGTLVKVEGYNLVTDANGEARAPALHPGVYTVTASHSGYSDAVASVTTSAAGSALLPICLNAVVNPVTQCDVSAQVAGTITTAGVQNGLQLRLTNNLATTNAATLTYSSAVPLTGPTNVLLQPGESRIVNVYPQVTSGFSGSSVANVNVRGSGTCSTNLQVPLNLNTNTGLSIQALTASQTTHAGGQACYDLLLRNQGSARNVHLVANSTGLTLSFDNDRFVLENGETRTAKLCATVPDGATGQRVITVNALTSAETRTANLVLNLNPFIFSNVLGCFNVNGSTSQFMEVKLTNIGQSESFVARLTSIRGFAPRLTQENLFNFVNNSQRSLYVQVDPSSMSELDSRTTLSLYAKDSNVKVFEQELCFQKSGYFDASAFVSPTRVTVEQGKTGHAFVHVENQGSISDTLEVQVTPAFQAIGVVESVVSLLPNQEKTVDITVAPGNVNPGTYIVPISVYSLHNPAMRVQVASLNLVVDVKQAVVITPLRLVLTSTPTTRFETSTSTITLVVPISNYEENDRTITPSLTGLPQGWTYTVSPSQVRIPRFSSTVFNYTISAKDVKSQQDYNVAVTLTDELGRQVQQPVVLPAKSSNWPAAGTGLFTFGSSGEMLGVFIFILVVAGLYLLYKAWMARQEVTKHEALFENR